MPPSTINYQKKLWWLIGISVFAKILLSFFLELGNDEVYYYTYALQPDWNHFDHPPMVGWLIRIFTFNLNWLSDLSMRLGSIICAALATIVIFESGTLLKNEKQRSIVLENRVSPFFSTALYIEMPNEWIKIKL